MNIKTTIENGKFLIPKGYYQIFGDTIIQEGDLWIDPNNEYKDEWLNTYILKEDNCTVDGEQFKEPSIVYIRKIEDPKEVKTGQIPNGWIKIDSTEVLKEGDYFYSETRWWLSGDWKTNSKYRGDKDDLTYIRQIHQSYIVFKTKEVENKDSNINNQNMNNNIEELKAQKAKIEKQIEEAEKIEQQKEEMNNLVVGDYIICLEDSGAGFIKDNLYIFKEYIREYLYVGINKNSTKGWYRTKFRKATNEEINQYLLKTFKVGDYITRIKSEKWNDYYQESWPIGKAVKITEVKIGGPYIRFECEKDWTGIPDGWVLYPFRKSTESEILEYQQKFERLAIGSYVVCLTDQWSDQFIKNNLYKITGCCFDYYQVEKDEKNNQNNGFYYKDLNDKYRAATPEEVENWEKKIKEEKEIGVGDWVFCTESKNVYKVKEIRDNFNYELNMVGYKNIWVRKSAYRKATIQEIEQHLRDEATKNGFVIGANVQWEDNGTVFPIEKIEFYKEFDDIKNMSGAYVSKQNFLIVRGKHQLSFEHSAEICEKLKLVEDTISINGYDAKYFERYIKFGCAEISINMLKSLKNIYSEGHYKFGNRKLEGSVMIGKGEFDLPTIEKLLNNHRKKFRY